MPRYPVGDEVYVGPAIAANKCVKQSEADIIIAATVANANAAYAPKVGAAAIANHVDPALATAPECAAKQNAILAALRLAGIIAT